MDTLIEESTKRYAVIKENRFKEKLKQEELKLKNKEIKRKEWAEDAINRLRDMNKEIFKDMVIDDWQWDGNDYIFYKVPNAGRIYYWEAVDPNSEAGYTSPVLGYSEDRMGFGVDRFSTWDQLAEEIARHVGRLKLW